MKKQHLLICWLCLCTAYIYAQNNITTTFPGPPNGNTSGTFWSRAGNTPSNGVNNVFGTLWNSSIYTYTNSSFKTKLNGNFTYNVNGYTFARDGFLLIGQEQPVGGGITPNYFENKGAFTRLHLHDNAGTGGFYDVESGYRPWMRNGVYFSGFSDAGYVGQKANAFDHTDMIFTWSDNSGQDNMTFAFTRSTGLAPINTTQTSGDLIGDGPNGREIMRFTAPGNIGMGPRFAEGFQPTNDLHIRSENMTSSFIQIDNQEAPASTPTTTSVFNGALFGMLGNTTATMNENLLLYNQENRHILIGTNFGVDPVNTTPSTANERVRITSVGAPTDIAGGYGVNNPYGRPLNNTYVAISSNPANSIKRPYSLLHIGEDMAGFSGVRPWMYHGTLINADTDNMYVGLKNEGPNRQDAVIAWGDDALGTTTTIPDNLRFIFTETNAFGPHPPGTEDNALEVGRFVPSCATCPVQKPSFGIGNFSPASSQPYGNPGYVGATLDVDGDARIRTVSNNDSLNRILVTDPADKGRIKYRNLNSLINGNNGIYYNAATGSAQLGVNCTSPTFLADYIATAFTASRVINLSGNSLTYQNGRTGFNTPGCAPGNIVEINAGPINLSGLRLRQLTSASPTIVNTGKVLSVDSLGDVILVDNGTANNGVYNNNGVFQLGLNCTNPNFSIIYPTTGLTTNRAVSLNGRQLTFDGNGGGRIGIGMGPCVAVNNRVEITGFAANQSGLRFTNLTYSSPSISPIPLVTPKYLTVDVNGDVILMDGPAASGGGITSANNGLRLSTPTNVEWGQIAGSLPALSSQLTFNTEIPMNNFNVAFSKPAGPQAFDANSMVIGTSNATVAPLARLEVIRDLSATNPLNNNPIGLRVLNTDVSGGIPNSGLAAGVVSIMDADNKGNYGGYFVAQSPNVNNAGNVAVQGFSTGGQNNTGIYGVSQGVAGSTVNQGGTFIATSFPGAISTGISAVNTGGDQSFGGKFSAQGGSLFNYGIYTDVLPLGPNDYAIYANGNVLCSGSTGSWSDSTMKTNFNAISNASSLLQQLNPYTFNYRVSDFPTMNLDSNLHFGLVAQNVETVIPDLVGTFRTPEEVDSLGNVIIPSETKKTVEYTEIIPILIAGFNEQQGIINAQDSTIAAQDSAIAALQQQMNTMMVNVQNQINTLTTMINNCCSNNGNGGEDEGEGEHGDIIVPNGRNSNNPKTVTDVRLTDTYCVLSENSPNPFKDHTVINYNLSETIKSAQIVFYNAVGQVIKVLEVNDRGEGRLNVYGEDLRSGLYTYSLIIDGNVCETKKMIKE